MVVGECEFTNAPFDYSALAALEDHAPEIPGTSDTGDTSTESALFTRSGVNCVPSLPNFVLSALVNRYTATGLGQSELL
ncbi:hypothetical protein HASA104033_11990 [Halobacterium salinarum]|uniref:Uncharacterized protein n=1 Tax=Halobacterium salinarum (strain ATCC 33171 / DSM 3754 / JCM 8978 / NBRC 102687 / NCIMB 764 / 91-R6) TaxID=2597657 RepID=A0A663ABZ2_HALS9|nr:hypothetical protein APQ99_00999 [Halobacterium salinarum DSM 3754]